MDDLSIWKVLASLINFLIVFWVFKYFLWEKIVLAIENRRKNIEASDNAEILAKGKIEQSQKEAEAIIEEAKEKADEIQAMAEDLSKQNQFWVPACGMIVNVCM